MKRSAAAADLNHRQDLVLWFDDLGTGNEEFRFLSNFFEGEPVTLPGVVWPGNYNVGEDGLAQEFSRLSSDPASYEFQLEGKPVEFPTGEHAFQAMKFWRSDVQHFFDIVHAGDPNTCKAYGRSRRHPLREDWEVVKLDVMAAVIRAKFTLNRAEGEALLRTGDKMLVEGTYWADDVWGVDLNRHGAPGRNWLGTLLMARRAELRVAEKFGVEISDAALHFVNSTGRHNSEFASMH